MSRVPRIRFKGFEEDWEQRKLGEMYTQLVERNIELLPFKKILSVSTMTYKGDGNGAAEESLSSYKRLRVGDIAFEGHTSKDFRYGRFVLNDTGDGIMSPRFSALRPISVMPIKFWKYYIHYEPIMKKILVNSTKSGTMMNELVVEEFLKEILLVPEEHEQQKIGRFFNGIDHLITLHQRKLEKLKIIKKSMLENLFPQNGEKTPKIRFSGFTKDWEQRKLGEIGIIITGSTPSTSIKYYYTDNSDEGIVWVTPTDIINNITVESEKRLTSLGQKVAHIVPKNTILVTCIASIGKNTMLIDRGSFNQQINGLIPYENKYEPYFLLTESFIWSNKMKSSAPAGTMQIVNRKEFSEIDADIPDKSEQNSVGAFFRTLDHLITLHQSKLEKLQKIKKSMLECMFI